MISVCPGDAFIAKTPFISAATVVLVPFTETVAKETGSPFTPEILPVAGSVCANAQTDGMDNKKKSKFLMRFLLSIKKVPEDRTERFAGFKKGFPASYKRTKDRKKAWLAVQ